MAGLGRTCSHGTASIPGRHTTFGHCSHARLARLSDKAAADPLARGERHGREQRVEMVGTALKPVHAPARLLKDANLASCAVRTAAGRGANAHARAAARRVKNGQRGRGGSVVDAKRLPIAPAVALRRADITQARSTSSRSAGEALRAPQTSKARKGRSHRHRGREQRTSRCRATNATDRAARGGDESARQPARPPRPPRPPRPARWRETAGGGPRVGRGISLPSGGAPANTGGVAGEGGRGGGVEGRGGCGTVKGEHAVGGEGMVPYVGQRAHGTSSARWSNVSASQKEKASALMNAQME